MTGGEKGEGEGRGEGWGVGGKKVKRGGGEGRKEKVQNGSSVSAPSGGLRQQDSIVHAVVEFR